MLQGSSQESQRRAKKVDSELRGNKLTIGKKHNSYYLLYKSKYHSQQCFLLPGRNFYNGIILYSKEIAALFSESSC